MNTYMHTSFRTAFAKQIATNNSIRASSSRLSQVATHLATTPSASPLVSASVAVRAKTFNQSRAMSSIPSTMKGVLVEKTGGVEVLDYKTDMPVPQPKEGEVLVKNDLIGINYIDTYFRTGLYPSEKPEVLGREAEGEIVSVGAGTQSDFQVGQRVVWMATGAYAEYTAVPATHLWRVPGSLARGLAAASILQGLTAITLIDEAGEVRAGDWALVHAAAGGVGQWLVQMLRARGAHVVATASTPEKRALAAKLGAEVVTGYDRDELLAAIKKATPGGAGVKAVFDGVGKDTFDLSLEAVARKGIIASFGNASGPVPPLTIARLSPKNAKVCRPTLFNYLVTDGERKKYGDELWDMLEKKQVEVGIHETYPLSEIRRAHTDLEGRKTSGKLLLDPTK